ncbi:MAG: hypothetical protein FJ126_06640 [Deltaproteobacteria bacterium]|nr:hypothetical protein [Deltaproteobacteria bacterium]
MPNANLYADRIDLARYLIQEECPGRGADIPSRLAAAFWPSTVRVAMPPWAMPPSYLKSGTTVCVPAGSLSPPVTW